MTDQHTLDCLTAGMPILYGGNRVTNVSAELAAAFRPGDRLVVVQDTGDLLHISAIDAEIAAGAVGRAAAAFTRMGAVSDEAITAFFEAFACRLADDGVWARIVAANNTDVASAKARGRSTTRLAASEKMRQEMIAGLREWRDAASRRGALLETIPHSGWRVEQVSAPLGVVAFVFEGRPNVLADATGVLRGGNTVVFRIGGDALGTAKAIMTHALDPALREAGLPEGAASLVESTSHAAGWALFSDRRLALAIARGSGRTAAQLGSVARQSGVAVSLHGTGGAWMIADLSADAARFERAVYRSLYRKVCNTLNVCCIARERAATLVPIFLRGLRQAGDERGHGCRLHVIAGNERVVPEEWWNALTMVRRAHGDVEEPLVDIIPEETLAKEWEWEETPEVTLKIVDSLDEAIALFNRYSPQFVASLIAEDAQAHARFFTTINAPFVGNGLTMWVDGQFALSRPELGLSNWENGRLFARGGLLTGDGVFTIRTRAVQDDPDVHR